MHPKLQLAGVALTMAFADRLRAPRPQAPPRPIDNEESARRAIAAAEAKRAQRAAKRLRVKAAS